MIDYNKRLVEVDTILNHLKKSDYDKIPKELIEVINKNKDTKYIWNYDETKDLKEQNVSRDTIAIISYINMKYLLNEQQKNFIQNVHIQNEQKQNNQKREKYNPDNLFKDCKQKIVTKTQPIANEVAMVKYKESIFKRFINKIKSIFHIK